MICPICESHMSVLINRLVFFLPPREVKCGVYPYYECCGCDHILLDVPRDVNLGYQSDYRRKMATSGDVVDGALSEEYYSNREGILGKRAEKIDSFIEGRKSVFDIGCGGGYMLRHYKDGGYEVGGIEIDDLSVDACQKLGIACIKGDFLSTEIEKKYDVVMAWHVLEHVRDINEFLRRMLKITEKNGLVIIEVPTKRALKRSWDSYDGHVHYFNEKSLKALVNKFNLRYLYLGEGIQGPALLFVGEAP